VNSFDEYSRQLSAFTVVEREAECFRKLLAPSPVELLIAREMNAIEQAKAMTGITLPEQLKLSTLGNFALTESAMQRMEDSRVTQIEEIKRILGPGHLSSPFHQFESSVASAFQSFREKEEAAQRFMLATVAVPSIAEAASRQIFESGFEPYALAASALKFESENIARVINSLKTPWASYENILGSASGVAQLAMVAQSVNRLAPFETTINEFLRFELGDYRDNIVWKDADFHDAAFRVKFYRDQGFSPVIAGLAGETISECLEVAAESQGVVQIETILPLSIFLPEISADERMAQAFQCLRMIERHVRNLVDGLMTKMFGRNWIKTHLSRKLRESWVLKQEKAVQHGQPKQPLIEYADFTEYEQIITGEAAWLAGFGAMFVYKEEVKVVFQRLAPARIAVMHSRDLVHEDLIILFAECSRLIRKQLPE
jgi:hypothetical protein